MQPPEAELSELMPLLGLSKHGFNPNRALALRLVIGGSGVIVTNAVEILLVNRALDHARRVGGSGALWFEGTGLTDFRRSTIEMGVSCSVKTG